jgi:nicotinamide phosphoribosyltransferase
MLLNKNLILAVDSYKLTHWMQFPKGLDKSFYYIEARPHGLYKELMIAGQHYLTKILEKGVTIQDVLEARDFSFKHFQSDVFNYKGWMDIATRLGGKLPITVRAVPEGMLVPEGHAILTVETHEGFGWLAGHLETFLLRAIWFPTTVATVSFSCKKILAQAMKDTSDLSGMAAYMCEQTRLHDFGPRGVSSAESSAIGGLAHLYNYLGSDNLEAIVLARTLFSEGMAGISIPAREHSTTTCYLRDGETEAFMNSVRNFGGGTFAVVIDSYSTDNALKWLTTNKEFLKMLTEKGGTCVLRPDSGSPVDMVMRCLRAVADNVGFAINSKGYKVLDKRFRVIQGDGVTGEEIKSIVQWAMYENKFSMENLTFGMGGGLLQHFDRDTQRFAMKCSAMRINGEWIEVFKAPETDPSKTSKGGRLDLICDEDEEFHTVVLQDEETHLDNSVLKVIFDGGERLNLQSFCEIRTSSTVYARPEK